MIKNALPTHRLTTRRIVLLATFIAMGAVGLLAWTLVPDLVREIESSRAPGHGRVLINLSDDRKLAGFTHNVFIGQVLEENGQYIDEQTELPKTMYSVKVLSVFKGWVEEGDEVTVTEEGGYWPDGSMFRRDDVPELLEPGVSYLLAARTYPDRDWHHAPGPYSRIEIDISEFADADDVLASQDAVELQERFTRAVENEMVLEGDFKYWTHNAYDLTDIPRKKPE